MTDKRVMMTRDSRRRRARLVVASLAVVALIGADAVPAAAQSRGKLAEARQKYQELQKRLDELTGEHLKQQSRLAGLRTQISRTSRQIKDTEARSAELQTQLRGRVRDAYRMGGVGQVRFLFDAQSFREFSLRMVVFERQAAADEDLMLEMRRLRAELTRKQNDLRSKERSKAKEVAALRARGAEVEGVLAQMGSLVQRLDAEEKARLARLASARTRAASAPGVRVGARGGGGGGGRAMALQACPAAGPRSFTNDWGAPRGGGRRRHKGTDVFAAMGSPAAAVVSGRISRLSSGGNAGLSVYLWGDDGNEYFYAHMSGYNASTGQRVSAGQTIAYVGNTGNARGGAPHIHFEIHPGGGAAINPYYSLIRVC